MSLRPVARLRHLVGNGLRRRPTTAAAGARWLRGRGQARAATAIERAIDVVGVAGPDGRQLQLLGCDGQDQVARGVAAEGWRSFEAPLPAVLVALVQAFCRGGTFADVGANTGYYAILAAAAEPTVRVHAFEPYPPVVDLLRRNCAFNHGDRIEVRPVALGAEPGQATLYVPTAEHGLIETSSSLNPDFDNTRIGSRVEVPVDTLERLYPPDGGAAPAVLKIDVESLEAAVLTGGAALLRRSRPIVVLELLPHEDPSALEGLRAAHDYTDIRLRPDEAVVGGPVQPDPASWNHLWVPGGRKAEVLDLLRGVGLAIVDP